MKEFAEAAGQEKVPALDLTLAQQMKINQAEIDDRLRLLDIGEADTRALRTERIAVGEHIEAIVDEFYDIQRSEPEISLLIGDQETFRRLHASMRRYVMEIFEGYYDAEYVNKRLRIGLVHKRIGVSPKLYISAVHILWSVLERHLGVIVVDEGARRRCVGALHKTLMFDIQLVFDTYIRSLVAEVETARDALERYADDLEREVAERTTQLEALSRSDVLTGVGNQRSFYDEARREVARAERYGEAVCLVYFDLNDFKALNDRDGHRAGDAVLARVGAHLRDLVRETDRCFRYGGDEFCVVLPKTEKDAALQMVRRLFARFDEDTALGVTLAVGVAQAGTVEFPTVDQLVHAADVAMYEAKARSKQTGGHAVVVVD